MIQRNLILLLLFLCMSTSMVLAQRTVSGKVIDTDGEPLIGVNILEAGTSNGTVTDFDGNYSLSVSDGAILSFSYTGYVEQSVVVGARSVIDLTLEEGVALDEVVVTALGISREKKALSYSAQNVGTEELSQARELNVVNSLSGKVAGISVARSSGGVGSASRVILRGNRSLFGSSEPLYIVDGVPILGDISDINPDDVASISVLKGANAAALYGNRAQNGAIIITTKTGGEGFNVSLSTTYTTETPLFLRNYQKQFGQGNSGQYSPSSEQAWGAPISGSGDHWSPDPNFGESTYNLAPTNAVEDFYQTGFNSATNLAISGGTGKTQTYFSYTYTNAEGVVPNNELARHNAHVRITNKVTDRLTLDAKLNYIREDIQNGLSQGESFDNPNRHAWRLPPNIRTADIEQFEYTDATGSNRQHYWNPGSNGGANPYWTINRNQRQTATDRVLGFASLSYKFTDQFSVQVRSSFDRLGTDEDYTQWNDNYIIADNGRYTVSKITDIESNHDILASYNQNINDDLSISLNAGANSRRERGTTLSANTGDALLVPNFFALQSQTIRANQTIAGANGDGGPRDVNSIYGFANIGYKNALYLDVTARNDWASTLPRDNRSFFYPSVGVSAVISELAEMPDFVTFAKLRGSWAQVGNDANPFQLQRTANLAAGGNNGFLALDGTIRNSNLRPEKTTSIEVGADLRFANNRVGLDFTWYKSNTRDQLFAISLPIGSGASQIFTNGGDVQNDGIEIVLNLSPVQTKDFSWDLGFNFAANNSEVVEVNDERPRVRVNGDFLRDFIIEQGQPWGNVYSRGFQRVNPDDPNSAVLVGDNGLPLISNGLTVQVANFNPDWLGGISNQFTWKDLSVSFLIDIRQGGTTASLTDAIVFGDGLTEETVQGREGGLIFGENFFAGETAVREDGTPNNTSFDAESFWRLVGGRNAPVGEVFTRDASNMRLRELVLGYRFPIKSSIIKSAKVSLVGRNLFFFYNKSETFDPESLVGTAKEAEGFESFAPPTARSFGLNLKFDF